MFIPNPSQVFFSDWLTEFFLNSFSFVFCNLHLFGILVVSGVHTVTGGINCLAV
jgi:hypothetical protein